MYKVVCTNGINRPLLANDLNMFCVYEHLVHTLEPSKHDESSRWLSVVVIVLELKLKCFTVSKP